MKSVAPVDENAFGLFISYHDIENDEYALSDAAFPTRVEGFRRAIVECLSELPLGEDVRAIDLGHAVYIELAEGDQVEDPVAWLKMVRARLHGRNFSTVGVLTHGSRWVDEDASSTFSTEFAGSVALATVSLPAEPLRRALYADAAAQPGDGEGDAWGPGLYLDTEAVEALGRVPKNAPTVLSIAGATFFRAGK